MVVVLHLIALAMIGGAAAAISYGSGIISLERGWTMVIAGSVLGSAGCVLIGVATVAVRLGTVWGELRRIHERLERAESVASRPAAVAPAPPSVPEDALYAALASALAEPGGARAPLAEPAPPPPRVSPPAPPAAPPLAAAPSWSAVPTMDPQPARPADVPPVAAAPPAGDWARFRQAEIATPAPPQRAEAPHRADERDWNGARLEPAPIRRPVARRLPDSTAAFPEAEPLVPGELPLASAADRPDLPEGKPDAAPAEPALEQADSVVGSYAAGDNSYVMYADGSIHANTPTGRYRFGSLDELKTLLGRAPERERQPDASA